METLITSANFSLSLPLITQIFDAFLPVEEVLIEWTAPDYERISFLWKLFEFERGERRTFRIRGKPGYVAAVVREFNAEGEIQSHTRNWLEQ